MKSLIHIEDLEFVKKFSSGRSPSLMKVKNSYPEELFVIKESLNFIEFIGSNLANFLINKNAPIAKIGVDLKNNFYVCSSFMPGYYNEQQIPQGNIIGLVDRDVVIELLCFLDLNGLNNGYNLVEGSYHAALVDFDSSLLGLLHPIDRSHFSTENLSEIIDSISIIINKKDSILQKLNSLFEDFESALNEAYICPRGHLNAKSISYFSNMEKKIFGQFEDYYCETDNFLPDNLTIGLEESKFRIKKGLEHRITYFEKELNLLRTCQALQNDNIELAIETFQSHNKRNSNKVSFETLFDTYFAAIEKKVFEISNSLVKEISPNYISSIMSIHRFAKEKNYFKISELHKIHPEALHKLCEHNAKYNHSSTIYLNELCATVFTDGSISSFE